MDQTACTSNQEPAHSTMSTFNQEPAPRSLLLAVEPKVEEPHCTTSDQEPVVTCTHSELLTCCGRRASLGFIKNNVCLNQP